MLTINFDNPAQAAVFCLCILLLLGLGRCLDDKAPGPLIFIAFMTTLASGFGFLGAVITLIFRSL